MIGEYWNVPANYNFASGAPTGAPNLTRNDQDINFDWNTGGPGSGVGSDWFYARWKGYFVAPTTGSYTFGSTVDDNVDVFINEQKVYGRGCCGGIDYTNATPVTLQAGQVVPIRVNYLEAVGAAYVKIYVKGAIAEQTISRDWLRTDVLATPSQYGLVGRYYTDDGSHNFPGNDGDPMRLMMARTDSKLNYNWGTDGPAPGLQGDNFMVRWTGYITVPTSGSYTLGATADDGVRIKVYNGGLFGTDENQVLNQWQDQSGTYWGSATNLPGGKAVPITVEYFEHGGGAAIGLRVQGNGYADQEIPVNWLTPKASVLPDSWRMGVDVDGNVNYERLRIVGQNAILEDSTRSTHEYTWTGSGYKPPVNEDGQLTRNADNTFTLLDTDGKTYTFDKEGKLTSVTTPTDDRSPAALKYTYGGSPSRLLRIEDGVTSSRYGTLVYKGIDDDSSCSTPSGFDAAPAGMLCAFKTSDGDITKLYYKADQLSRVEKPGGELTDYKYDTLGRITNVRDSLANDAITAGVRADDTTVMTELNYDAIGRISSVKTPAPTANANRATHGFEYLPGTTQMHIVGTSEPNGFSKRIEYDPLLRTTKETDVTNQTTLTEWDQVKDLQLSTTDATGLKSTTIYDNEDRSTDSYGPAPAAWYETSGQNIRKPFTQYASQVPHTSAGYDEGINGPAVSYMAVAQRTSSVLSNGETLTRGQDRRSTDGRFQFIYQTDGNVVLYGPNGAIWNNGKGGVASDRLVMQGDGNLVLYNGGSAVWSTGTGGGSSARLIVGNDGNTYILTATGATWATNTANWSSTAGAGLTSLKGSPLLNTTNLVNSSTQVSNTWTASPLTSGSNYWGVRMTGKLYLPTTGNWTFRIVSDNGVRMSIDDNVVIDDWTDGVSRSHPSYTLNNTNAATVPHRLSIDYYHLGGASANFTLYMTPAGGSETADVAQYIKPGYSLTTSQTAYDANPTVGNVTTTTQYTNPAYGTIGSTTLDPGGLNYQSQATYEAPGTGFLRQTSKTLPGGGTTTYQHYSANDTADNPCTTGVEAFHQAGRPKGKIEADPDGAGSQASRTSETIYNESGDVVATRYNSDPWTCTAYDARGRIQSTVIPAIGSSSSRTVTNDYAKDGNPLITTTADNSSTIRVENDLLGRTVKYTDAKGKETISTYDDYGKLTQRVSPIGTETYQYDNYDRLTTQKLDGVTFATVTYDQYSRIANVQYPAGLSLSNISRDTLGRENGNTYSLASGTTLTDSINRYVSGDIQSGTELGVSKAYTYDKAGRLTSATIGGNTFSYGFGTQDASCPVYAGYDAGKDGNRTSLTVNGQTTTYCYDKADRLTSSSDPTLTNAQYDDHGNTISLGDSTHQTTFTYDGSDRNTGIVSGNKETTFTRDVQNRIVNREQKTSGTTTNNVSYGFTGNGDTPDFLLDGGGNVIQKYVTLPGDIMVTIKVNSSSAGATTFSLPNIHGDIFATVNADGALLSTFMTGPFGEVLPATITQPAEALVPMANPTNAADGTTYQYVGQHEKMTDLDASPISGGVTQMGARVYIPLLGRFLSVDSIEGGTDNNYAYANNPVNDFDLDGTMIATQRNMQLVKDAAKWLWQKRNEFVAWKDKNAPWVNDAVGALAMVRGGGKGAKITPKAMSNPSAMQAAAKLGYNKSIPANRAPFNSHGQPVFQKGNRYITQDVGTNGASHKGGTWKVFERKGGKYIRQGTYDSKLKNRIGR